MITTLGAVPADGPPSVTWLALAAGLVGLAVAQAIRVTVRRRVAGRGWSAASAKVVVGISTAGVLVPSALVALTLALPGLDALTTVLGTGLLGIAAVLLLTDVVADAVSGLLLQTASPFRTGDQIAFDGAAGTVVATSATHTVVRSFDGRVEVLPARALRTGRVTVLTARSTTRDAVTVVLDPDGDIGAARAAGLAALGTVDGVADDPAPEALIRDIEGAAVRLEFRWWSGSRHAERCRARDLAIGALHRALRGVLQDGPHPADDDEHGRTRAP